MIRAIAALLALVLLTGCESPRVVYRTQEVRVPVVEPCIEQIPDQPEYATESVSEGDDIDAVVDAYLIERQQMRQYNDELRAEMAGCVE